MHDRRETIVPVSMGKAKKKPQTSVSGRVRMCSCRFAWQAWHFVTSDI